MTTDAWGIDRGYFDIAGVWHDTSEETRAVLRQTMGDAAPASQPAVRVVREGTADEIEGAAELTLEDGTVLRVAERLPSDLPLGYHELRGSTTVTRRGSSSRPVAAICPTALRDLGLGRPALRRALERELGHRRPRRSRAARALVARRSAPGCS